MCRYKVLMTSFKCCRKYPQDSICLAFFFSYITLQDFHNLSDGVKDQSWRVLSLPYTQSLPACVWTPAAPSEAFYFVCSKSANDHANCAFLAQLAATGCYGFDSVGKQNTKKWQCRLWHVPRAFPIRLYFMKRGSKSWKKGTTKIEGLKMVFRCRSSVQILSFWPWWSKD